MRIDVGMETYKLLFVLFGSFIALLLNKVPKSLVSSPLALSNDNFQQLEASSTFLQTCPDSGFWFLFDVLFTNIVIRQLVVFCWWSLWSLENSFLSYQNMDEQSAVISYDSLLVGFFGSVLSTVLDKITRRVTLDSSAARKASSTVVTLIAFFSCVNVWRGLWSFLNVFFLPSLTSDANYMVGHLVGLLSLTGLFLTSTIASDAIVVDTEEVVGEVVSLSFWRT